MEIRNAADIQELYGFLRQKYSSRDAAYKKLRRLYNADYWSGKPEISGIKLVYNLLSTIVDKFSDFMSLPPDWRVIPTEMTTEAIEMADKQEKFLYSQWELNNIQIIQQWQAHLQSLLGSTGFEILPNIDDKGELRNPEKYVKINVLAPDFIYPMPKSDNINDLDFVIVIGYDYKNDRTRYTPQTRLSDRGFEPNIVKYFDENKIVVYRDDKEVLRIEHEFGMIPVVLGQNRPKPHFVEGNGDLEQATGLNEYLNELISWQADVIEYAANPITIIKNYTGDKPLNNGPGAKWFGGNDFNAQFLSYPGTPPDVERQIQRVMTAILDVTSLSEPVLGRDVPSGTSGQTVRPFVSGVQGALLRKQVTMGHSYVRVNELIFETIEKIFPNKEIRARGTKKGNLFLTKFQGKDINQNYRNQVIWPAGVLDQPSRINLEIQKLQSGLVSRFTAMENIGVTSPTDEMELIRREELERIERERLLRGDLDPRQAEFNQAQNQLSKIQASQPTNGGNTTQAVLQEIANNPKIKGAVLFEGEENGRIKLVLTNMQDKAIILQRLPAELKGNLDFRRFKEDQDEGLQIIVDKEE